MIPLALGSVEGLGDNETVALNQMMTTLNDKVAGNEERMTYYLGHDVLKDLGIAIPPFLTGTSTVVGWPAKAVDAMASRSLFDGFIVPDDAAQGKDTDPLKLRRTLLDNRFDSLYSQAVRSQLAQSVVFWTLTKDADTGKIHISARPADMASAIYDPAEQRVIAGVAISDYDVSPAGTKTPSQILLFFDNETVALERSGSMWGVVGRDVHNIGRPAFVAMPYEASEARPFGRSRITREVMSITDSAQRQALRLEVLMEFNTAPQKYLLGVEDDIFQDGKWSAYLSEIFAVSRDEEGELPEFGQLPQVSPQGAITYFNHLAARFSGASAIPLSSLGVVQDNPESAEAMLTAKDDLITGTQALNRDNRYALATLGRLIVCLRDGVPWDELPEDALLLDVRFRNPANPSVVSQSDAMVKQISAIPWLADTDVALEELGYDEGQITRLLSAKRRAQNASLVNQLLEKSRGQSVEVVTADVG